MENENENPIAKREDNISALSQLLLTQQTIPFLQLLTYNSTILADNPELKPGSFYVSQKELDLGQEFEAVPVDIRSYAYVRAGGSLKFDTFDINSEQFAQAISLSKNKKKGWQSKWGGMVLLYIPEQDLFVTYFLAGMGGGIQCLQNQVTPNLGKLVMFASQPRKNRNNNRWMAPTVLKNATTETPELPTRTQEILSQFNSRQGQTAEEEDDR